MVSIISTSNLLGKGKLCCDTFKNQSLGGICLMPRDSKASDVLVLPCSAGGQSGEDPGCLIHCAGGRELLAKHKGVW